ncbi:MAG TPA: hypothetical protein VLJ61_09855 [Pyrinomonadaceae bacterium]|nr:hypothetical protein [Pyrinomonadaceae bacterium]
MKTHRHLTAIALAFSLAALALAAARSPLTVADAQEKYGALERGYRTGYSDGYQSGWADQLKGASSDFRGKSDFRSADRAYISAYGSLEDYRDGYQQGYEVGYQTGYSRGGFDSNLPPGGVSRRGATARQSSGAGESSSGGSTGVSDSTPRGGTSGAIQNTSGPSPVASDTTLLVELKNRISTDVSQRGDSFEAQVVEPKDLAGAIVAGHLADVRRPGKTSGRAMLQLEFERIQMPGESDFQDFHAQVVEVIPSGDTGVADVDPEGGIRGKDSTKNDVAKVGAGAGVGAIIGGIAGGGKGAAIGAAIGGGAGTARVMTQRGKDIHLEPGQQLRIRSTGRQR